MIGNMGHIVDIVSNKYGYDKELLKTFAKFYWKTIRTQMINSDYDSIQLHNIGNFITSTKMFRRRVKYDIARLRSLRKALSEIDKEENPERFKLLKDREVSIILNFKKIWKQFNKLKIKYYNIHQKSLYLKKQRNGEV